VKNFGNNEYRQVVKLLDHLVDEAGENEKHPLASLMEGLGVLVEKYEDENVAELAKQPTDQMKTTSRSRRLQP
jgi:antitoxin component HigA of HigAB toxin-antitoxin module